jgi:hypothetical protein
VKDQFNLGGPTGEPLHLAELEFGHVDTPPAHFQTRYRWYPFDGVLGLGLPGASESKLATLMQQVYMRILLCFQTASRIVTILTLSPDACCQLEALPGHQVIASTPEGQLPSRVNTDVFSLHLGRTPSENSRTNPNAKHHTVMGEGGGGTLVIGGVDETLFEPPLKYFPVLKKDEKPPVFWSTGLKEIQVGRNEEEKMSLCEGRKCSVVVDTGSSIMTGPSPLFFKHPHCHFVSLLFAFAETCLFNGVSQVQKTWWKHWWRSTTSTCSLTVATLAACQTSRSDSTKTTSNLQTQTLNDNKPTKTNRFSLEKRSPTRYFNLFLRYMLTPNDYVVRIPVARKLDTQSDAGSQTKEGCFLGIEAHSFPEYMGNLWVLGSRVQSKFYTVFDRKQQRIGLAIAKHA